MIFDLIKVFIFVLKTHPGFFITFSSTSVPKWGLVNVLPSPLRKNLPLQRFFTIIIVNLGL